ncbi:phosphoribosylglycinamide formyltransferase [Thermosulfuriphilus sp.]
MASYRIGWFTTGRDQAAYDLLDCVLRRLAEGLIPAQLVYIFISRAPGEASVTDQLFALARRTGAEVFYLSAKEYAPDLRQKDREAWRHRYHEEVSSLISPYPVDVVVLAGYMLIVSAKMCREYPMINLHPAAPGGPSGTWQEVIWKLLEEGASESGVMMHLVTPELDQGPPITYCTFPIRGDRFDALGESFEKKRARKGLEKIIAEEGESEPLFAAIRQEGLRREFPLIVYTLKALAEGRVRLKDGELFDEKGKPLKGPYCLNEEIEEYLRSGKW